MSAVWNRTMQLKDLLGDDDSPENTKRVAREMSKRLRSLPDYHEGECDDFTSAVDEMADIATDGDECYRDMSRAKHFNLCLDAIYDWADAERVWIS